MGIMGVSKRTGGECERCGAWSSELQVVTYVGERACRGCCAAYYRREVTVYMDCGNEVKKQRRSFRRFEGSKPFRIKRFRTDVKIAGRTTTRIVTSAKTLCPFIDTTVMDNRTVTHVCTYKEGRAVEKCPPVDVMLLCTVDVDQMYVRYTYRNGTINWRHLRLVFFVRTNLLYGNDLKTGEKGKGKGKDIAFDENHKHDPYVTDATNLSNHS